MVTFCLPTCMVHYIKACIRKMQDGTSSLTEVLPGFSKRGNAAMSALCCCSSPMIPETKGVNYTSQ